MRIIITGFIVLVIWSFLSMWLYVDILKPAAKKPVVVTQPVDSAKIREADSLAKLMAAMPKVLVINFDFDKFAFDSKNVPDTSVAAFKAWLDKYPSSSLTVTGHTDFIGTPEYNTDLGLTRAKALHDYLAGKGIPAERMIVTSAGETQPVAPHVTSDGRMKNRRTEIAIKHN
ncbi:MAG: OmpA family protein [Bacteroidales bacterium]